MAWGCCCWNRNYSYYVLYSAGSKLEYFGKDEVYYSGTGECYKLSLPWQEYRVRPVAKYKLLYENISDFPVSQQFLLDCSKTIFQLNTVSWATCVHVSTREPSRNSRDTKVFKLGSFLLQKRKQSLLLFVRFQLLQSVNFPS